MPQCAKHPVEALNIGFDFGPRIPGGLTISTPAVSLIVGDITLGSPSVNGTIVSVRITGGTNGTPSSIEFKATLSDGEILVAIVDVPVSNRVF